MNATQQLDKLDEYIHLTKLPAFVPGRPHKSTIFRWIQLGVVAPNGERIKLETNRVGGRIFVKLSDLQTFLNRLNERDDEPRESDAERLRRSREAGRALEALGC